MRMYVWVNKSLYMLKRIIIIIIKILGIGIHRTCLLRLHIQVIECNKIMKKGQANRHPYSINICRLGPAARRPVGGVKIPNFRDIETGVSPACRLNCRKIREEESG